ncbi:MAG: hypothetical protein RLP45_11715, partial [Haliea sp.]
MSRRRSLAVAALALGLATGCLAARESAPGASTGWPNYGGRDVSQYSPLTDITPANVGQLELAWQHRSGDFSDGSGDWGLTSFQVTPLVD